ncbi:glycosyltransferase [Winogradskyella sp. 3972H.M.0a.05]|uniref:glycosyltransferase family 2 protein n=1 Tax=Winogradskyella sp. 3972H.M.0a.05 TaxID=2950277 RepID=UPI0033933960
MPYFSVVIPLYNKELHIQKALDSVLHQSFEDFEVIVVNDGSTDNSETVVKSFKDDRISIYNVDNGGPSRARNFGVSKATSELIAFLDGDDYWKPHHLEDLKNLYEEFPGCGLYAKAYDRESKHYVTKSIYKDIPDNNWKGIVNDFFHNSMNNCIAHTSAIMIPKQIFDELNGFNENFDSGEDTDLWIRAALHYPVAFHNKVSSVYRIELTESLTSKSISKWRLFDLNAYKNSEVENKSLKAYLDLNRLSLAFQYKMAGFSKESSELIDAIDNDNISKAQRLLLSFPSWLLKLLLSTRNKLRLLNVDFRLFK